MGNIVIYNGKALTIALIGEVNILLQTADNQPIEFPQDTFENLIRQGKITSFQKTKTNEIDPQALELLQQASEKDLKDANHRYRSIQPYLNGQPIRRGAPQERSLRNWLSAYKKAQQLKITTKQKNNQQNNQLMQLLLIFFPKLEFPIAKYPAIKLLSKKSKNVLDTNKLLKERVLALLIN